MRRTFAAPVLALAMLVARTAAADRDRADMDIGVRWESLVLPLRDTRFTYAGKLANGGADQSFDMSGGDMGVDRPRLTTLSVLAGAQFLKYGTCHLNMEYGWGKGDAHPADPNAAIYTWTPPSIQMIAVGIAPGVALPLGNGVAFGLETRLGARFVGVALPGYERIPCGRGGNGRCTPSASHTLGVVEPRFTAEYESREGDVRPFVQAFVGADLAPVGAYTMGLAIGVHVGNPPGVTYHRRRRGGR
jgi:hypothetical protein